MLLLRIRCDRLHPGCSSFRKRHEETVRRPARVAERPSRACGRTGIVRGQVDVRPVLVPQQRRHHGRGSADLRSPHGDVVRVGLLGRSRRRIGPVRDLHDLQGRRPDLEEPRETGGRGRPHEGQRSRPRRHIEPPPLSGEAGGRGRGSLGREDFAASGPTRRRSADQQNPYRRQVDGSVLVHEEGAQQDRYRGHHGVQLEVPHPGLERRSRRPHMVETEGADSRMLYRCP